MRDLTISLQALVAVSIFFVWVVRYDNVVEEFKLYRLPDWLRDLVGVMKLTFSLMLLIGIERAQLAVAGSLGIAFLMVCAVFTHLRVKNRFFKMLPSLTLLVGTRVETPQSCTKVNALLTAGAFRRALQRFFFAGGFFSPPLVLISAR